MSVSSKFKRIEHSYEIVDAMPPQLRQLVHEFGFAIVNACIRNKVTDPARIRDLVKEIWEGARQPTQRRRSNNTLDWVLMQAGAEINADRLLRVLGDNSMVVLPREPTTAMIEASKATVANFDMRVTKTDKHRLRLRAANKIGAEFMWPGIL